MGWREEAYDKAANDRFAPDAVDQDIIATRMFMEYGMKLLGVWEGRNARFAAGHNVRMVRFEDGMLYVFQFETATKLTQGG